MNDITALMATMKAAAEKAIGAHERLSAMPSDGLFDASLAENAQLESDITALIAHNDASTPANVKALVEALETKEELRKNWFHMAQKLGEDLDAAEKRIAELEGTEQKLCAANVTLDARAELAERRLAELESRTVTVKLPRRVGAKSSWQDGPLMHADEVIAALTAAGIQVIEGEQRNG
ncbi:ead/Ea22-like family protein [Kluyvera sichuanensis]|uniref:ead/Ea22-like family protein n=1 Tax=Kluyvera sichuanensis TaxID=2725494 RepID=UPI0034A4A44D